MNWVEWKGLPLTVTQGNFETIKSDLEFDICIGSANNPVIRIKPDGGIFWNGREVATDEDFRSAMLEVRNYLLGAKK